MKKIKFSAAGLALGMTFAAAGVAQQAQWDPLGGFRNGATRPIRYDDYSATVHRVAEMVGDPMASQLVQQKGLSLLNLTWEDTGRYKGSSVGPNISDMTIQVQAEQSGRAGTTVKCMPVIRYDNFSDKTADLDPEGFSLLVGNERGKELRRVSLREFLLDPSRFLTNPGSWKSRNKTLLADRDTKVLVSAQACFLPVPKQGKAKFNPVLFNYQSSAGDPAVLTILATREGTSATIIDNKRDAFNEGGAWGQRLFFNQKGQRASLTGERLTDFKASSPGNRKPVKDAGLNMVLLIQVPLKQKPRMRDYKMETEAFGAKSAAGGMGGGGRGGSDVEAAVIGHGEMEGPFTEIDNLAIERDDRFPVRVTVQFYKATSNGVVSEADVAQVKDEIDGVYAHSDSVGSLVVGGETGRITEYEGSKVQPVNWWNEFWLRYEKNMGIPRWEAIRRVQKLLGKDYQEQPVCRLYLHDLMRPKG